MGFCCVFEGQAYVEILVNHGKWVSMVYFLEGQKIRYVLNW